MITYLSGLQRLRYATLGSALIALLAASSVQAAPNPPSTLNVQAQSYVEVEPDKATLSARLWENTPAATSLEETDTKALSDARQRLEERASQLITAMQDIGIEASAINAGSLSVSPDYVAGRANQDAEQETLIRTRVERPFSVELADLDQLGAVFDALIDAGVNSLDGVQFDLRDRDAATDEALTQALEKARHKAELMADTLDTTLGPVQSVEETQAPVFQPRMMAMRDESGSMASSKASDYSPGTIRIDASVRIAWEIIAPDAAGRPDSAEAPQE